MPDGELLIERRKYPRWSCPFEVKYKTIKGGKPGVLGSLFQKNKDSGAINVSGGGAMLVTDEDLKPGDKVSLSILLKSTESAVKIIGEVVRIESEHVQDNKKRVAVKFVEIHTESDDILQDLIRSKMRFAKNSISAEEAMTLAQREYFLRMMDEELRHRGY